MTVIPETLDRHFALLSPLVFGSSAAFLAYKKIRCGSNPLSGLKPEQLAAFSSSLIGASSGLLGFTVTAIAILTALPRAGSDHLRRARIDVARILLWGSLFLLISLVSNTFTLLSADSPGFFMLAANVSSSIASAATLLMGGVTFAWAIVIEMRDLAP